MRKSLVILFSAVIFCTVSVFAQDAESKEEKLITEFIKLKNVPECNDKDSIRCIGMKVSFKNFNNIAKNYLTIKGSIEFDRRSRTLILTEVSSNLEFMKEIILSADRFELFLVNENEEDEDEKSECKGWAGGY